MNSTSNNITLTDADIQLYVTISRAVSIYCLLVYIAYFLLVFMCPELRIKPYLFVNHAVFANALILLTAFINSFIEPKSTFQSFVLNVCSIFEVYWRFLIYLCSYSIVLIAIHRYIAVFRVNLFNRINSSTLFYMSGVLLVWAVSLGISFLQNFIFNATYSLFYCTHGFSLSKSNRIFYTIFTIFFAIIMPSSIIITIYVKIIRKLRKTKSKLNEANEASLMLNEEIAERRASSSSNQKREAKFANQFICMLIVVVLIFSAMIFAGIKIIWSSYFSSLHLLFTALRCFTAIFATFIPIFSVYFNPSRERLLKFSWP